MKPYKLLVSVLCVALLLSACGQSIPPRTSKAAQPTAAPKSTEQPTTTEKALAPEAAPPPKPHGLRSDAPPYAISGPHGVGVRHFRMEATKASERPLNLTIWYPTLGGQGPAPEYTYEMIVGPDETPLWAVNGHAALDAKPDVSGGPYPLVVYSHAHTSFSQNLAYFIEHLATQGFVVMSVDHQDNQLTTLGQKAWQTEYQRPDEVRRQIAFARALTTADGPLAGVIDTERVGVAGFSLGGGTALAAGGARLDLEDFRKLCESGSPDIKTYVLAADCVNVLENEEKLAALAGLDDVPEGLWPDWSDEEVDAVIAMGPTVAMFGSKGIESVRTPTMLLVGSTDSIAGPLYDRYSPYDTLQVAHKTEVVFEGGAHLFPFPACRDAPDLVELGLDFYCSDPVWDMDRAHDLINHFVTAFLLAELKSDAEAAKALAPENVSFPGIQYESTAYGTPAKAAAPSEPHGLRFDAPPYAVSGPYGVGVRYFTIPAKSETDRELTASVWYPAIVPGDMPAKITYEQNFKPGKIPPFTVLGHARLDAKPDASGAPYPLVVYTHSHWSMGQELAYLTEHLASRGFVVISVDHEDNWSTAFGPMPYETLIRRPQEVTREIDFAERLSASDGDLEGMITTEKVGIAGWSLGGVTSVMEAGARLDLDNLRTWCEEDPAHAQFFGCTDVVSHEEAMAKFAGLDKVPTALWPDQSDERIAAAARLSGATPFFGKEGLAAANVPVMLMHGGYEGVANPAIETGNPYASVSSERKAQVVFEGSGHYTFFSSCAEAPDIYNLSLEMGFPTFCADAAWDMNRAHDLINHFTTAFLMAELKGDAEAAKALAPKQVSFPGIAYQAKGYGAAQATIDTKLIAEIEALVAKEMADKDIPGVSLGIVKDGQIAYAKGFGLAERGTDRPMTPQTQFPVACVTKGFTTVAIMQLVEQGLVKLDAPVTDYLPYFKLADERYKEITIHHLLANTAGLPMPDSVKLYGGFSKNPSWSPDLLEKYVRSLADKPMATDPAANTFVYGGDYFDILGDVIAKVSGQQFEEYMDEHILRPLGLEHTTFIVDDLDPKLAAAAHWQDADGKMQISVPAPTYYPAHTPSNGMFSTTEDLLKWAIFNINRGELNGKRIVSASAYDVMWKPQVKVPWGGIYQHWGYGWGISDVEGHHLIFWGGGHIGSPNQYYLAPDEKLAVHVGVNRSLEAVKGNEYADAIAFPVIKMLLADEEQ